VHGCGLIHYVLSDLLLLLLLPADCLMALCIVMMVPYDQARRSNPCLCLSHCLCLVQCAWHSFLKRHS